MISRVNRNPLVRRLGKLTIPWLIAGMVSFSPNAPAMDLGAIRNALVKGPTGKSETPATPATVLPAAAPALTTAQDRLARTTQAITAVRQMQQAARALAQSGANNLKPNLPAVPVNSFGLPNGLVVASGVPKDLANPQAGENASLWTGASLPTVATQTTSGTPTSTVTIAQNQQQAVLNWDSFNIGKSTTLNFDQSAGGANVGQWIAFNKVGVTGNPSQILGSINAGGQVYVINPNGIIFGGSSQVNAHALVASSLPINDNLIARGLLNNPDNQFLFSTLPIAASSNTPTFTPTVSDNVTINDSTGTYTLALNLAAKSSPVVSYTQPDAGSATLTLTKDFAVGAPDANGKTTLTFTTTGLQKISGATVSVAYTPTGDQYGNVEVQAGALLTAPTTVDHIGGRVALIGTNVTNAGTISTADGQTILAAGLQVGVAAHTSDASLRGLDVYVGAVADPGLNVTDSTGAVTGNTGVSAGTITNASLATADIGVDPAAINTTAANPGGGSALGLIQAARGDVFLTGQNVNQLGVIDSSTSVAFNGRVDLVASYNGVSSRGQQNAPPFFLQNTGAVVLGAGSITQILPDLASTDTVVGTTLALPSAVRLEGASITLAGAGGTDLGAALLGPNANVTASAGNWRFTQGGLDPKTGFPVGSPVDQFIYDAGDIVLGSGSAIDVSGSQNVSASVSENIVSVQLRGPELANSPLQRDGPLRGQTIQIDVRNNGTFNGKPWVGTPLADTAGYVGLIQHSVGELTVDGGSVAFKAGDGVTLQTGSSVNVSGGWINYQGANIQTTKLETANGHVVDISQATPDQVYVGIATGNTTTIDPKWGVTRTTSAPLSTVVYDPGYTAGGNGGRLTITASSMELDGNLRGQTTAGASQLKPFMPYASAALLPVINAGIDPRIWELGSQPMGATLSLTFQKQYLQNSTPNSNSYLWYSPAPPDIFILPNGSPAPLDPQALVLSSALVDMSVSDYGGFAKLQVDNSADNYRIEPVSNRFAPPANKQPSFGTITVAANTTDPNNIALRLIPGGSLTLDAANIDLAGGVVAPGGTMNLTAHNFWQNSTYNASQYGLPSYDPARGNFTLEAGVSLSTAGMVVDRRQTSLPAGEGLLVTGGGAISIAGSNVTLGTGSVVNVDGGATIATSGRVDYGAGGTITLKAGADPGFGKGALLGGNLEFDVAGQEDPGLAPGSKPLQGYSGGNGGTLNIVSPLIQVGSAPGVTLPDDALLLSPEYFSNGGFSAFSLQAQGRAMTDSHGNVLTDEAGNKLFFTALDIAPETTIHPRVQQMQVAVNEAGYQAQIVSPLSYQYTPTSLKFGASGVTDNFLGTGVDTLVARGDLVVGKGVVIQTDPTGTVALNGQTVALLGSVQAPGGAISISGGANSASLFHDSKNALPTVDLGPTSSLSVAGTTMLVADVHGNAPGSPGYLNTGSVLPGGTITVTGNIVAEAGSVLDVSGASDRNLAGGLLNLAPAFSGQTSVAGATPQGFNLVPTVIDSNGGGISFTGGDQFFIDAALKGAAGGPLAAGGSLSLTVTEVNATIPSTQTALQVTQNGPVIPGPFYGTNASAIGQAVVDTDGKTLAPLGYFAADSFASGGFDNLALNGNVSFLGPVKIAAKGSLTVATGGLLTADDKVTLSAAYVALGQPYQPPPVVANPYLSEHPVTSYGTGTLEVIAGTADRPGLVDIGNLSLRSVGQAAVTSVNGDIRGFGILDIAGRLDVTAGQVYPATAEAFTIAAYDYHLPGDNPTDAAHPGSVSFAGSGTRQIPLSAGGTLNIFASQIDQGGVLRAPMGSINLGWNGAGAAPVDPITNSAVAVTTDLTLEKGSETSVSANLLDPTTGKPLPIPYGVNLNGTQWVDPTGTDISNGGLPAKTINLSAGSIAVEKGATIDTSGGGDLFAYQFIKGVGGTNDVLSPTAPGFAIVPGYQAGYAPDATFNTASTITNLLNGVDAGYTSLDGNGGNRLQVGDQVLIDLGNGQGPRSYTLLPARYALLPGAYLITPQNGTLPVTSPVTQPDGTTIATGYRFNAFDPTQPLYSKFEIAPQSVVQARAQYEISSANDFFSQNAAAMRLPIDGGQLVFAATHAMMFQGSVSAAGAAGGRGGLVDISSPEDIFINDSGSGVSSGTLYLSASDLSNFGAGSLLIGGTRTTTAGVTKVNVTAGNLTVDKTEQPLTGPDIILVANETLTLAPGASVEASGTLAGPADSLQISGSLQLSPATGGSINLTQGGAPINFPQGTPTGDTITSTVGGVITLANGKTQTLLANKATTLAAGSTITLTGPGQITAGLAKGILVGSPVPVALGDGTLLRVSNADSAPTSRTGIVSSGTPLVQIGAGAKITAASVTLDSTYATNLDPTAVLGGGSLSLNSGQISLVLDDGTTNTPASNSLVLTGTALASLQTGATALSLFSYSSIDLYGSGQVGSPSFASLGLHAAEIRGFDTGTDGVTFAAKNIILDNSPGGSGPGATTGMTPLGALNFNAGTITLGSNALVIDQFAQVQMTASGGIQAAGSGALTTPGSLTMTTPVLTGAAGAAQVITAGSDLAVNASAGGTATVTGGLGASLKLQGSSVEVSSNITLPSGSLALHANGGAPLSGAPASDVTIAGALDVSGTSQVFQDRLTRYTDAGQISLLSDYGSVILSSGGSLNLSAQTGGGSAGVLSIGAPNGIFALPSNASGAVPAITALNGHGGTFMLDVSDLSAAASAITSLSPLEASLFAGNFTLAQSIRVRTGDVVVDGIVKSRTFDLSADQGNIDVASGGVIDATGPTGGSIDLAAAGSVVVESGAKLSVQGQNYNHAGQGGTITLEAGSYTSGSTPTSGTRDANGNFGANVAAVDVQAGSQIDLSVVNSVPLQLDASGVSSISVPAAGVAVYFPSGTPGNDRVSFSTSGTITTAVGVSTSFTATPDKPFTTALALDSTVILANGGTIAFASGSGGSIPVNLPSSLADGTALQVATSHTTDLTAYNSAGTIHLRASQVLDSAGNPYDVQINPIGATFLHPVDSVGSNISVEGFQVFDLSPLNAPSGENNSPTAFITGGPTSNAFLSQPTGGLITDPNVSVQASVEDNGALFAGGLLSDGSTVSGNSAAITAAVTGNFLANNPDGAALLRNLHVRPGAEIVNRQGDLVLQSTWDFAAGAYYSGSGDPALAANWSLAMPFRFGPNLEPGYLTLRARGKLIFSADPNNDNAPASLNDGFAGYDGYDNSLLWAGTLLPAGMSSWSYRLVAGADFGSADSRQVLAASHLVGGDGSVLLGQDVPALMPSNPGLPSGTNLQNIIVANYQTIRTGTGDIGIYAGGDVQILNNLATIYTAGSQAAPLANFDQPANDYPAQYATGGGNVTIISQGDIAHLTANGALDSSLELPMNWLNRRGWVDPTGQFGSPRGDSTVDSTSWWIDYSNFFEGVGALGGGNVTLIAGRDISNVDAVVPTNERTPKQTKTVTIEGTVTDLLAADQPTFELGGGDLLVRAGHDIDAGVYYVERGTGTLEAGGSVHTNSTRATLSQQQLAIYPKIAQTPSAWLPTSLFLGKGNFTIIANGDLLLGAVANPFLLPQSAANAAASNRPNAENTFFSTYATGDSINVSSLTGTVTLKAHPDVSSGSSGGSGSLLDWLTYQLVYNGSGFATTASTSQPWLSLFESNTAPFTVVSGIMPSSLEVTVFGGDLNLVGGLTLLPSPQGQLALAATGSINGMQPNALTLTTAVSAWGSSLINLSDADPSRIPGLIQPLALSFQAGGGTAAQNAAWADPGSNVLPAVDSLFNESGSTTGAQAVIQTKQALHAPGPLHADDKNPAMLFAESGDISGLTLFAGKSAQMIAGRDITDVALYVQNNRPDDITTIAAGRDFIPYDPSSLLRTQVQASGQQFFNVTSTTSVPATGTPTAGDIQIGGQGTLEILAGRNLSLGVGPAAPDGTSVGIKSIGNTRNPSLPFSGANIVVAAGIGRASSLGNSQLDFATFISEFLNPATAGDQAAANLPALGSLLGISVDPKNPQAGDAAAWDAFNQLTTSQQDLLAMDIFYLVLRNAGRDRNNPQSPDFGSYNTGYEALAALLNRGLDYSDSAGQGFVDQYLNPASAGNNAARYLPQLGALLGDASGNNQEIWQKYSQLPADQQQDLARKVFAQVLDEAAQQQSNLATNAAGKAAMAQVLASLFSGQQWQGSISLATREIETTNGGDISLLAPGGSITVGRASDPQKADQGLLTAHGGNIAIFANDSVNVGTSRIFTLRGGNEIIWSTNGNIAAGSGSKTVFAAPPTRVLIDPQSGDVQNDLAGLATGSGIGVLATLAGVKPGDVDLIAPVGTVDAGDAGIRSSGNLNIAAAIVLNASNIQVGGSTVGTPPPPPAPNLGALGAASSASAAASSAANDVAKQGPAQTQATVIPSIISVEVLGYGGGDSQDDENSGPSGDDDTKKNSLSP